MMKPGLKLSAGDLISRFVQSIERSSSDKQKRNLQEWTFLHRVLGGKPFTIEQYPFLTQVYADHSPVMVVPKAAQMGISEFGINRALWALDELGMDILYLLPTDDEAYDFSNARFGPALEGSAYLERLFTDVSNTQHKRAGELNFFIRGSRSKSKLKSMPIDFLVVDEYDEMVQPHLPMARRRLDASPWKWELDISTPTVPEYGIHARWLESDQHQWAVQCPKCSAWQVPTWPDNINLEGAPEYYWCASCHHPTGSFRHWLGKWESHNPGALIRGYHISQLFSPNKSAMHLAVEYRAAMADPAAEQEFWNQGMGLPHVSKGGTIDHDMLLACRDPEYREMPSIGRACSMGVDVGSVLHARISIPTDKKKRAVYIDTVPNFEDLDGLMNRYNVRSCVIDEGPEHRKVMEFCQRFAGRAWGARYTIQDKAELCRWNAEKRIVDVNRTVAMDRVMSRVQGAELILPAHAQSIPDYFTQMKAPKRMLVKDKRTEKMVYRYVDTGKPDHYAHAELYDDIAFERLLSIRQTSGFALNLEVGHQASPWKI